MAVGKNEFKILYILLEKNKKLIFVFLPILKNSVKVWFLLRRLFDRVWQFFNCLLLACFFHSNAWSAERELMQQNALEKKKKKENRKKKKYKQGRKRKTTRRDWESKEKKKEER